MPRKEVQLYVGPETPNALEVRDELQQKIDNGDIMSFLSLKEIDVLKVLLDRHESSLLTHGGLKSILQLTDDQEKVLLDFLKRI